MMDTLTMLNLGESKNCINITSREESGIIQYSQKIENVDKYMYDFLISAENNFEEYEAMRNIHNRHGNQTWVCIDLNMITEGFTKSIIKFMENMSKYEDYTIVVDCYNRNLFSADSFDKKFKDESDQIINHIIKKCDNLLKIEKVDNDYIIGGLGYQSSKITPSLIDICDNKSNIINVFVRDNICADAIHFFHKNINNSIIVETKDLNDDIDLYNRLLNIICGGYITTIIISLDEEENNNIGNVFVTFRSLIEKTKLNITIIIFNEVIDGIIDNRCPRMKMLGCDENEIHRFKPLYIFYCGNISIRVDDISDDNMQLRIINDTHYLYKDTKIAWKGSDLNGGIQ